MVDQPTGREPIRPRDDDGQRRPRRGAAPADVGGLGGDPQVATRVRRRERARPQDETSLRGGVLGIVAVTVATIVITGAGALISLVVALLY